MSVAEIKNNALGFATGKIASLQESLKEVDWKGHAMTFINFGKDKAVDAYKTAKYETFWKGFRKAYKLAEYVPVLNAYAGMGRMLWACAYGAKVTAASLTTRPFKYGINETFKKYWMEEMPYVLKQFARGFVIGSLAGIAIQNGLGPELTYTHAGLLWGAVGSTASYTYDVVTNNVEQWKNNKYIPNYWS